MITCTFVADPPRVVLDVTGMPDGTATVEVVRIADNGSQAPVRGASDVPVQDTAAWTVIDWEPPVGRSPVWRASYRNSAGGLLATEVGQVGDLADVVGDVVTDEVGVKTGTEGVPAPDGDNRIANGGAEDGMTGWSGGEWYSAATDHHTGTHFFTGAPDGGAMSQTVAVSAGRHTLSAWVGHPSTVTAQVTVTPNVGSPVTVPLAASSDWGVWTQTTAEVTIPDGATSAVVSVSSSGDWCRIDDLSLRTVAAAVAGIPAPDDPDTAWISNPYDPSAAMLVTLMAGSDDDTSHDMDVSLSLPGRRTHLPSAVVGVRGLGGKRTLVVRCWTPGEAQQLEDLLASTTTLLVRSAVIRHRTGCLYVVIGEAVEHREWEFLDGQQETTWTLSSDEVDPGALGILVPPWTYQKSAAYVAAQTSTATPTYTDRAAVFPLHIDATRGV